MKLIFLLFFAFNLIFCENLLKPIKDDKITSIISRVLLDFVDEFFIKEKIEFNVFFVYNSSLTDIQLGIFTELFSKSNEKFKIRIQFFKFYKFPPKVYVNRATIFFLNEIENFLFLEEELYIFRYGDQPFKFVIFDQHLTYSQLESHDVLKQYEELTVFSNSVFFHSYFLTDDNEDTVSLSTVEWFSPKACNRAHLSRLNTFNKKSMKWASKLENYEKFLQYHGCELVLMLPTPMRGNELVYPSGYAIVNNNQTDFQIHGLTPVIFNTATKINNFTAAYQPVFLEQYTSYIILQEHSYIVPINNTFKRPNIFLLVDSINTENRYVRTSNVFVNLNFYFVSTPAEAYTPYEKLFLPFDFETWISLGVTFFIAFLVIFIINRFSTSIQQVFYGVNVKNPFWNVIRIFFGISQTKLPIKSFSRFILLLFLFFCLIFRTCYQNKLFEFMTSEPRRSPPILIADLIDRNYNVFTLSYNEIIMTAKDRNNRRY